MATLSLQGGAEADLGVATIPELLAARARRSGERIAYRTRDKDGAWQSLTWREVEARVLAMAAGLQALGLGAGDRLAIMMPTGLRWELLEKAALTLGAAVVGIDSHAAPAHKAFILGQSRAKALVLSEAGDLAGLEGVALPALERVIVEAETLPNAGGRFDLHRWADFAALCEGRPAAHQSPVADTPAAITYTSGTGGQPKGIVYSHRQMLIACESLLEAFGPITEADSAVCWLPLSNLFQRVMNLCGVGSGAACSFVEDPRRIVDELGEIRPTIFIGVPRFYEKLREGIRARLEAQPAWRRGLAALALESGEALAEAHQAETPVGAALRLRHALLDRLVLTRLRAVMGGRIRFMITGSAPAPAPVLGFYESLGLPLLEAYGLSENIVPVAVNRPGARRPGTVGRPLAPNEVRIAADGEVLVRGPGLFGGYLESQPGGAALDAEGFFATGDLGGLDPQGFLRLTGRKREIIKTSTGRRIGPQPLEAALREIPGVEQALVVGNGCKTLAALVTPALEGQEPAAAAAALEGRLGQALAAHNGRSAPYERIAACLVLAESFTVLDGHLTPSLKLRRSWLEQRYAGEIERLYEALERWPTSGAPLVLGAQSSSAPSSSPPPARGRDRVGGGRAPGPAGGEQSLRSADADRPPPRSSPSRGEEVCS